MRKKANKADIEFIRNHVELSSEEIAKEIDLEEDQVLIHLKKAKSSRVLDSTKTKIKGAYVLSQAAADALPKAEKVDNKSIHRFTPGQ